MDGPMCRILIILKVILLLLEPVFVFFASKELGLILNLVWHVDIQFILCLDSVAVIGVDLEPLILEYVPFVFEEL